VRTIFSYHSTHRSFFVSLFYGLSPVDWINTNNVAVSNQLVVSGNESRSEYKKLLNKFTGQFTVNLDGGRG